MDNTLKSHLIKTLDKIRCFNNIGEIELECRFGYKKNNNSFVPDIESILYHKILNELCDKGFIVTTENTVDSFFKFKNYNVRETKFIEPVDKQSEYVSKNKIFNQDIDISSHINTKNRNISHVRISVASEKPIKINELNCKKIPTPVFYIRKKKRISFVADIFSIDMSIASDGKHKTYEIEVEIIELYKQISRMSSVDIANAYINRLNFIVDCINTCDTDSDSSVSTS